jgi:anti-sigma regulatory factor (Ser/Thr protein kinase)
VRHPTEPTFIAGAPINSARALISSRRPLDPSRLTAWARRCVSRLPAAAELPWPTDDRSTEVALPGDASAVRATRQHVASMFKESSRLDDILLAASELAANAVQHGGGPTTLVITTGPGGAGGVVIEVGDRSVAAAPVVLPLRATTSTGRGMAIVDVVSDCWGVLGLGAEEKVVWCEFFHSGLDGTR